MKKKKIFYLTNFYNLEGGASIAAHRIFNILKKNFILFIYPRSSFNYLSKIKYYFSRIIIKLFLKKNFYLNSLNIFSSINLSNYKFDILHLNWIGKEIISIKNLNEIKKPIIWTMHDMWALNSTEHFLNNPKQTKYSFKDTQNNLIKKIIFRDKKKLFQKKNIYIVANSKWLANCAKKSELTKECNIRTIYNPLNTLEWRKLNEKKSKNILKLDHKKKYILFGAHGGFKNFRKGGDLLVEAIKYLNNEKEEYEVIVLGGSENNTKVINKTKFNFRELEKNQYRQNLYHSASNITVSCSRAESLPQFIIETILCENPVVSFDVGGINEIIKHKQNGYIANCFDIKKFASGINYCMKKIKLKNLRKARKIISYEFSENHALSCYKKLINSIN